MDWPTPRLADKAALMYGGRPYEPRTAFGRPSNADEFRANPEFESRFGRVDWSLDKLEFDYVHPNPSAMDAVYIYTSRAGDHNGAFLKDHKRFSFSDRLYQMSEHYNVRFKRVDSAMEAQKYLSSLPQGTRIKHLVLGGHGSQNSLVLGRDTLDINDGRLSAMTLNLLDEIQPMLTLEGEHRSRVFLDSCLTGTDSELVPSGSEINFAALVARRLAGSEVLAFDESIGEIITTVKWTGRMEAFARGHYTNELRPFSIMYKPGFFDHVHGGRFDVAQPVVARSLLETGEHNAVTREDVDMHVPGKDKIKFNLTEDIVFGGLTFQECADLSWSSRDSEGILFLWPDDLSNDGICILLPSSSALVVAR